MRRLPPHWQLDNRSPREVTAVHPQSRHQMIPPSQIDNRSPREVTAVHPQSRHQTPQNQTPQNQTPQNQTPQSRLVRPSVLHPRHRSRGWLDMQAPQSRLVAKAQNTTLKLR